MPRAATCTAHLPLGPGPLVFVDDRPEDLAPELEVLAVSPYLSDDPHDRGLGRRRSGPGLHLTVSA